jgi:serine/threonine protein kinase
MHKDIKPDNIMLDANDQIILTDFGLSLLFEGENDIVPTRHVGIGTPYYFAPE